jgi:3-hydroxyacyl-CoA dehydrogenase
MFYADCVGLDNVLAAIKRYEAIGPQWKPAALLAKLAAEGGRFNG